MDHQAFLVTMIALVMAAVFLALWQRRDRGQEPRDDLADALHEPVDRQA